MIDIKIIQPTLAVILIVFSIFGGGIGSFLVIRNQLLKITKSTLDATQEELKIYKGKTERLETDVKNLISRLDMLKTENMALITERDYLKSLIIGAINSKKDIHKELLDELRKPMDNLKLYRDGEEDLTSSSDAK